LRDRDRRDGQYRRDRRFAGLGHSGGEEDVWFHVDGCIGALIAVAPETAHRVAGIEKADSVALDPHKWLHAPFEARCALVRGAAAHRAAFAVTPEYLESTGRGAIFGMQARVEVVHRAGNVGRDAEAARRAAEAIVAVGREHSLALYQVVGALLSALIRAKFGERDAGSAKIRQALADFASGGDKLLLRFYQGLLAEIEPERGHAEAALAGIHETMALAGETGGHWFDAALNPIRGEILLKQNLAGPAPTEAAFLAAIAIAQQQKARSFELRAALSLAKLYQFTGRSNDAHDILGPALEGFSPTPEFPQIAEATVLFQTLAHL
jgi:hypothetical protein